MQIQNHPIFVLDDTISTALYTKLDLSTSNPDLDVLDMTDPYVCETYIAAIRKKNNALVAYGGYLEQRNLYADKSSFSNSKGRRNIHLGIDFWIEVGTKVIAPLDGVVHSFQNNSAIGDYGPTIILQHTIDSFVFHTLYGHLSLESIQGLTVGQQFTKGETLARLGSIPINVNYAPHLHFQIIIDMEGKKGDYPGVCSRNRLEFYKKNCPNPNILLQMPV